MDEHDVDTVHEEIRPGESYYGIDRMKVPGGWLYVTNHILHTEQKAVAMSSTFVPDPNAPA